MAHLLMSPLDPRRDWTDPFGIVSFAKRDEGGGSDDDEFDLDGDDPSDDSDDEDDDEPQSKGSKADSDDEDDDGDDDGELPEKVKKILRQNRKDTRAAKAEARQAKEALASAQKAKGKKPKDDDEDDDSTAEAEARGTKRGLDIAKKASVRGALLAANLSTGDDEDRALSKAMRLIDLDELEVKDDGTISGLRDAIADLKEDFPSMFKRKRPAGQRINGDRDSRSGSGPEKKLSATERQAARLNQGKSS